MKVRYLVNIAILTLFLLGIALLATNSQSKYNNIIVGNNYQESSNLRCSMGVNLAKPAFYSPEMKFRDLIKVSTPFKYFDFSEVPDENKDVNGYVKSIPKNKSQPFISISLMKWQHQSETTDYVFLYDGSGEFNFFVPGRKQPIITKESPGRIELKLDSATNNLKLRLRKIDKYNYPRNFRLIPLEDEIKKNKPFLNDRFKKIWGNFKVYRHLDTLNINNSKLKHWDERRKPSNLGGEMALEDIIKLHNEMQVDVWLLIPHLANQEYIEKMAKLVKNKLDSKLKVYIEYTNEPWNTKFEQSQWLLKNVSPKYDNKQYNWSEFPAEYGRRASKAIKIFTENFDDSGRLVRVFNAQMWNINYIKKAIKVVPGLMNHFDAIALGYYIGHGVRNIGNQTNADIINHLIMKSKNESADILRTYKKLAQKHHLKMIAYEAGQHLQNRGNKFDTERFIEINKDPKMKEFYKSMANEWFKAGGDLIVWFNTSWKTFGILESQGQDLNESPKYLALDEMLKANACP